MLIDYPVSLRHFACTKLRIYFTLTLKCVPVFGIINDRERGGVKNGQGEMVLEITSWPAFGA